MTLLESDHARDGDSTSPGRLNAATVAMTLVGLAWIVFVAYVALEPRPPRVPETSLNTSSAVGHFTAFVIATAWIYLGSAHLLRMRFPWSVVITVGLVVGLGIGLELAQSAFTETRAFQLQDLIADFAGAAVALAALLLARLSFVTLRPVVIAVLVASLVSAGGTLTIVAVWDPDLPYEGDHWHTRYLVVICGEPQPPWPLLPGGIHSHGDQLIHTHPHSSDESGRNANLARFFANSGAELTDVSITLPGESTYTNGDQCPDGGEGTLTLHKFDISALQRTEAISGLASYVPRDLETLLIEFGSEPFEFRQPE